MKVFILFVIVWLAFAFFDFSFSSEDITAYSIRDTFTEGEEVDESLPKYMTHAATEYRLAGNTVKSKNGDFINSYSNCEIFDKRNWTCTYEDDSVSFGFKSGDYFSTSNLAKFPHLSYLPIEKGVSRFRYIIVRCQWDWLDGPVQMIACLFRPFAT